MSRHRQVQAPKRAFTEAPEPAVAPDWFDEWEADEEKEALIDTYAPTQQMQEKPQ